MRGRCAAGVLDVDMWGIVSVTRTCPALDLTWQLSSHRAERTPAGRSMWARDDAVHVGVQHERTGGGGAVDDPAARVPRGGPPLGAAIRHRLITIVVTVAIASGLAGFYVAGLQSTYTSILLRPAPGNPLSPDNASG